MPKKLYPALVLAEGDGRFSATLLDIHANAMGGTVEEALEELEENANDLVPDLKARGPLPEATPIADIPEDRRADAALVSLVPVTIPGRAKAVQITMDEDLLARIDAATNNRSGFLAEAARARLDG